MFRKSVMAAACLASTFGFLSVQPARAEFFSGNDIYGICGGNGSRSEFEKAQCAGYVGGVVDAFITRNARTKQAKCIPAKVTVGQLQDVVVKFMRDRPQTRDLPASGLINAAILDAWPACRPKK
jgi:hypothetical protein